VPAHRVEQQRQRARAQHVVVVEGHDVRAGHLGEADVAGGGRPPAGVQRDEPDPRVLDGRQPRRRVVGRAVVDDDDLELDPAFAEHGVEGVGEELPPVVGRDDDPDQGNAHRRSGSARMAPLP
jgi:hypothetical protein